MTRFGPGGLLGVFAAIGTLLALAPATPAAAAEPSVRITGVQTESGVLRLTLSARDVPPTTPIDPKAVRVRVGETALPTEARVATATDGLPPRALMVVVDAAADSAGFMSSATEAVGGLLSSLPADVQIGLVVVADSVSLVLPPGRNRDSMGEAVEALAPGGSATLSDGVFAAYDALTGGGFAEPIERRVVVVSDGGSFRAGVSDEDTRSRLAGLSAPVDVVGLGADGAGLARLRPFSDVTGGWLTDQGTESALAAGATAGRAFAPHLAVTALVPNALGGGSARVDVDVDGLQLSSSTLVAFAAAPAGARLPTARSFGWLPGWLAYVLGAVVFLALAAMVLAIAWPRSQKQLRIKQIAHFGPGRKAPAKAEPASAGSVIARTALAATASVVRSGGMEARIALRLERAGMKLRPHEWVLLRTCVTVASAALLFALIGWLGAIMGLLLGWLLTVLYQSLRVDRRANLFAEQLPDALQLVIGSLRSGFSLPQSLESLVRESPDPVAAEFGRALTEYRLGADVSDALERVAQRTQSEDLGWTVMAVRIQREVGGNLAEVLQTTVDTMRERGRLRRHVRALSAEGRLSAWVLIGLPIALGGFMFFYRREYMTPLFTDPLGLTLLVAGGLLLVIGIFWMTRVIKVEA